MRSLWLLTIVFLTSCSTPNCPTITTCFPPSEDCVPGIVSQISHATNQVLIAIYYFTSDPIRDALIAAHERGVHVSVIMDKSQESLAGSEVNALSGAGITVWIDGKHPIFHDKYFVIDKAVVISGSMNLTNAGRRENAENVVFIHDRAVAQRYYDNWLSHREHAKALVIVR